MIPSSLDAMPATITTMSLEPPEMSTGASFTTDDRSYRLLVPSLPFAVLLSAAHHHEKNHDLQLSWKLDASDWTFITTGTFASVV